MKRVISLILLVALLTSCSAAPAATTEIATQIATESPIVETTQAPTEAATATQEVTQAAPEIPLDELVSSFGLRETPGYEDRTFVVEGNYLIDQHNNVPKLVKENGTWRELDYHIAEDAEVMYGALAPVGGGHYDGAYINRNERFSNSLPNFLLIAPNMTGDWRVVKTQHGGEEIDLYEKITVLRDDNGTLGVAELAWDSPDVTPEHYANIWCETNPDKWETFIPDTGTQDNASYDLPGALNALRVGRPVAAKLWAGTRLPERTAYVYGTDPKFNDEQLKLMTELFNADPGSYSLTTEEYTAVRDKGVWPQRVVTLALDSGLTVQGDRLESCLGSVKGVVDFSARIDVDLIHP